MTLVNDPTVWAVSNASMKSLIMGKRARFLLEMKYLMALIPMVIKGIASATYMDNTQHGVSKIKIMLIIASATSVNDIQNGVSKIKIMVIIARPTSVDNLQ